MDDFEPAFVADGDVGVTRAGRARFALVSFFTWVAFFALLARIALVAFSALLARVTRIALFTLLARIALDARISLLSGGPRWASFTPGPLDAL